MQLSGKYFEKGDWAQVSHWMRNQKKVIQGHKAEISLFTVNYKKENASIPFTAR